MCDLHISIQLEGFLCNKNTSGALAPRDPDPDREPSVQPPLNTPSAQYSAVMVLASVMRPSNTASRASAGLRGRDLEKLAHSSQACPTWLKPGQ